MRIFLGGGPRSFEHWTDDKNDTFTGTPSPNFRATNGRIFDPEGCNVHQVHLHGGSSMESGFETRTLRARSRVLTTRQPRQNSFRSSAL
ncbi:hypothetical protein AVEN_101783-1 [Araneus ventricosus]|uniref:Uncharacterized protein n=1 Tax=Araneus ventricosus TaxID=182803 RepID=A0A4Y2CZ20_ARAVE|nr:hypothetical protein AVEN_101783-1 [Araneus ventricosus]